MIDEENSVSPRLNEALGTDRTRRLDALGRLVHAHRVYLAAVARAEGLTPEDALDVVQEVFFVAVAHNEGTTSIDQEEEGARRYLSTIARNLARNRRRSHAVKKPHDAQAELELVDDDATSDELVVRAEERLRLIGCVRTLEKVQRAVVTLRMLDERPGEDVARELGLAPGHVAVLLHRAKKSLLVCLSDGVTRPWRQAQSLAL